MQSVNPDYEAMAAFFALQSDLVKTHSQIVDVDLVGQSYMLHIDKNTPAVFTPMMPRSADHREDNTTARITVAPTLIGCFIGYNRAHQDFTEGSGAQDEGDAYRGGYEICTLDFEHCLKVDNALVPDATASGEHWLVGYTEATRQYQPTPVGKVFVSKIAQKAVSGGRPNSFVTLYIEVKRKQGFKFSQNIHLDEGYWKAEVLWKDSALPQVDAEEDFVVKPISQADYEQAKKFSAALLSHETPKPVGKTPAFFGW